MQHHRARRPATRTRRDVMTLAQGRRWKKDLLKDLEREAAKKARERERALRREIQALRRERDEGLREVRGSCAARRARLRDQCRGEQEEIRAEVRRIVEATMREMASERREREELRRIERGAKAMARGPSVRPAQKRKEAREESDEQVLNDIEPRLHALFHRVKRSIKGSDHMSRTEAFMHYVHENPDEALGAIDDQTDALIEEMQRREAEQYGGKSRRKASARRDPPPSSRPRLRLVGGPEDAEARARAENARLLRARSEEIERETTRHRGARYARERDVKDVARLVRQDIAKEVKMGRLPKARYSVTIERYSMGKAVNVRISDVVIPGAVGLKLYDEERLLREIGDPHGNSPFELPIFSAPARRLLQHVEDLVKAYQESQHHGQSDYHRTNFHSSVDFDGPWESKIRAQQLARVRARAGRDRPRRPATTRHTRRDSPEESPGRGRLHRYVVGFRSGDAAADFRRRTNGRPADDRTVVVDAYSRELDRDSLARLAREHGGRIEESSTVLARVRDRAAARQGRRAPSPRRRSA